MSDDSFIRNLARNTTAVVAGLGWRGLIAVAAGWFAFVVGFFGAVIFVAVVAPEAVPSPGGEVHEAMLYPATWTGTVALGAYQFGLMGVMRQALLHGDDPGGFFSIVFQSLRRLPNTAMAMIAVGVAQMLLVCPAGLLVKDWGIPVAGIVGFALLAPFVYLAGAQDETSLFDSLKAGTQWLKSHAVTISATYAALFAVALLLWGLWLPLGDTMTTLVKAQPSVALRLGGYLGLSSVWWMAVQLLFFLPLAALFYTIDADESGLTLGE